MAEENQTQAAPEAKPGEQAQANSSAATENTESNSQEQNVPYARFKEVNEKLRKLEARIAQLLGKEDALVFPTCTMANTVGLMLGAPHGSTVVTQQGAHMLTSEANAGAALSGRQVDYQPPQPHRGPDNPDAGGLPAWGSRQAIAGLRVE